MNSPHGRPLHVLVLGTTFPATPGDGTPEFVLTLSSELAARGHRVTVVVPQVPGAPASQDVDGVEVRRFRYFPKKWEDLADGAIIPNLKAHRSRWLQVPSLVLAFWWRARREIRRGHIDVVHAHWILPAGVIGRFLGRPYLVTAHGGDAYALSGPPFDLIKKMSLRGSSGVVPVSEAIGEKLRRFGGRVEPAVPMGVDVEGIGEAIGERRPVPGQLLFVGRLVRKKGVDDLLRALAEIPEATLRVVGDGPSGDALKALAVDLGVTDRVEFLGKQPRTVVLAEMATAAASALPSKVGEIGDVDGVPVVLSEAMAARLPVIASDAGGLGEHVVDGENGWLFPAGDVGALTTALRHAITDPDEAARRAAVARERMVARLSITAVGDAYDRLLRAAVEAR